jgi:transcriptional regulator with XRE-family HTH domain
LYVRRMPVVYRPAMNRHPNVPDSPIRRARLAAGMSPEGLADRAQVSLRTIERIEQGNVVPRRTTLAMIALALGVDSATLLPNGDREAA